MKFYLQIFLFFVIMSHSIILMSYEKEIDQIVNQALEEFHVPGAAIGVIANNKIILTKGYGLRDVENQLPVTAHTVFPIASNTKAFTSFLIGQLVEEGKVFWDDPVIQHIPNFRLYTDELSKEVTLRDLIAHRTGIPRNDALWYLVRDMTENDILDTLPHFPPLCGLREKFQYNNFMYAVAGQVIQNVTGCPWEEIVFLKIFKPLEMEHSGTSLRHLQEISDLSNPYIYLGGKVQKLPFLYPSSTLAASAIHSSIIDMTKWIQIHLFGSNLIQEKTLKEMHSIHMPFDSEKEGSGLGWEIDCYYNYKHVYHTGTLEGFFSKVSFLPEEKIGLVILTNNSTDGSYAISLIENQIYNFFLNIQDPDSLEKIREKYRKVKAMNTSLKKYEGKFSNPAYGTMQISIEYDSLFVTLGKMKTRLKQKEENIFEAEFPSLLAYEVNSPFVEFSFFTNAFCEIEELHVPFEHFRSAPPIIFKKH